MTTIRFSSRQALLLATLAAGLLTGAPALLHAQGINAKAAAPSTNAELLKVQQKLAALQERVTELEKPEVEKADDPEEASREEARNKAVERRLAALEKSVAAEGSKKDPPAASAADSEESAELTPLKRQLQTASADIAALKDEVAKLKARDPAKPADGQSLTLRAPFAVKDAAGQIVFQVDVPADRNLGRAIVGNPAGAHVEMGPASGGSAAFALYDDSKKPLVVLVGDPQRSFLRLRDSGQSVGLGNIENVGTGLFLRKDNMQVADVSADKAGAGTVRIFGAGDKIAASLSSVPEGGTLKTFNKEQQGVAAVFAGSDGGHVALTGPSGGKTAVQLSVTPTGGKVRVFPAEGGKARAELIADGDAGAITVFNGSGTSAVVLEAGQSGAGRLIILNAAGENAVEAGAMSGGMGIVRAGPAGHGPAGMLGGGLFPASSIQGKKVGK